MSGFYAIVNYWAVAVLLLIGVHGMLARPNLMRKLMAMNIFQVAAIIFYLSLAEKIGADAPVIATHGGHGADVLVHAAQYVNPLPHALMLTAIVVGVSTTGVALALIVAIYRRYGTIEEPELLARLASDK
ncbi:MAG: cation:proton antiporter subunit C [Elusimicrobiota bacterium]